MGRVPFHAFSPRLEPGRRRGKCPYELHGLIEAAILPVTPVPACGSIRSPQSSLTRHPLSLACTVRAAVLISLVDLLSPDRVRHGRHIAALDLHLLRRQLALLQEPGGALWRPMNYPAASREVSTLNAMNPLWTQWSEASRLSAFICLRPSQSGRAALRVHCHFPPIAFNRNVPPRPAEKNP